MATARKLEVYYDGSCRFCLRWRAAIERRDTRGRLRFVDYNDPKAAASTPFSAEELSREMHVLGSDGSWSVGYAAWVRILRALPRLAWLGAVLALPPFRWAGPSVYRQIARHRKLLPASMQPCSPYGSTPDACTPDGYAPGGPERRVP